MGNKDVIIVILPLSFFFFFFGRSRKVDNPEDSQIKKEVGQLVYFVTARVSMPAHKKYIS